MMSYGPFYQLGIYTYTWNKLFRREVIYDAQMAVDDRISIGEDSAAAYPALLRCRKVVVSEFVSYHYRQLEDLGVERKKILTVEMPEDKRE